MSNPANEANAYNRSNDYEMVKMELIPNKGGDPVSILLQFVELELSQSIFEPRMVGTVVISDAFNFSETVPMVGLESIFIQFKTKGAEKMVEILGKVFAIEAQGRMSNEKGVVTKIRFVSEVQYKNHLARIRSAKTGSTSEIARKIFVESFGDKEKFFVDTADLRTCKFVFPYWSPLKCIDWLSHRSLAPGGSKNETPSCYMFYEDIDGFHFKDIMLAASRKPVFTYRVEPNNAENQADVNRYLQRVQEYSIDSHFDRLLEHNTGMYAGTMYLHDITTKKFEIHDFDYRRQFDNARHLNEHPLIPYTRTDMLNSRLTTRAVLPVQTQRMDGADKNIDNAEDFFQNRMSIIRQFNTIKMALQVPGNSSLRLMDTVELDIPKSGYLAMDENDWRDIYLSGRYIITSMKHTINSIAGYTTTLELAKDSLIKAIPDKVEPSARGIK